MSKKNLFLIICAIILFIILSIAIKADYLYGFESWIYSEATEHMSDFLTTILIIITNIGGPIGIMCVCAIIFAIPKLRNRVAIPVTLAVTSSFFLNNPILLPYKKSSFALLEQSTIIVSIVSTHSSIYF